MITKNNNKNNATTSNIELSDSNLEERIKSLKLENVVTGDNIDRLNIEEFKLSWEVEKVELEKLVEAIRFGDSSENTTFAPFACVCIPIGTQIGTTAQGGLHLRPLLLPFENHRQQWKEEKIYHPEGPGSRIDISPDIDRVKLDTKSLNLEDIKIEECSQDTLSNFFIILQDSNSILGNDQLLNLFKNRITNEEVLDKYRKIIMNTSTQPEKFKKIIELDGSTLKINLDLEKSGEFVTKGLELIKNVEMNALLTVSGSIIPTMGTFYFYKKVSYLFAKHLEDSLKKEFTYHSAERTLQQIRNRKFLALFNISAMVIVGVLIIGFSHAIKQNTEFPTFAFAKAKVKINTKSSFNSSASASGIGQDEVKESIIPLFILNILNKLPQKFKKVFSFILLFSGYFLLNKYSSVLLDLVNPINIIYLIKLLDLLFIFVILESAIILYYLSYNDNILENKIYKLLPKSLKNEILSSRQIEYKPIVNYYSKTILFGFLSLILLIIGEVFFYLFFL